MRLSRLADGELLHVAVDRAAGRKQILETVVVEIEDPVAPPGARRGLASNPGRIGNVGEQSLSKIAEKRKRFIGDRCHENIFTAIVVHIPSVHSHGAESLAVVVEGHARRQRHFPKPAGALIAEQKIRSCIVGYEDIQASILIEVEKAQSHSLSDMRGDPGGYRDVGECAVPVVVIELVWKPAIIFGVTVRSSLARGASRLALRNPLAVVHD